MKRKFLCVLMAALMLAGMALPGFAYKVGDKVSTYAYTDIVTYINNTPIESFNINWETAVIVEDLEYYGFNVVWDPTPGNRNLKVTRNYNKPFSATFKPTASTHKNGDYAGDVLFTDIVTYFEGTKVDSFNINGRTIVYVNDIAKFYAQPGTYKYDDPSRTLSLTLKGAASTTPSTSPSPTPSPAASSDPLKITTQPANVTAEDGASVQFSVAVTGGKAPYTYKWEMKRASDATWSDAGWTTAVYTFTANQSLIDSSFMFRCVITDSDGNKIESNAAQLLSAAVTPLTIVTQPISQPAVSLYTTLVFTVQAAGGTPAYSYKWEMSKDGVYWFEPGGNYMQSLSVGVTTDMLSSNTYVRCTVSDSKGLVAVSNPAVITGTGSGGGGGGGSVPAAALTITSHPSNATVAEGGTCSFSVSAAGGKAPYTYEWHKIRPDGSEMGVPSGPSYIGEYTANLTCKNNYPAYDNNAKYYCIVTDANGTKVISNTATVTVTAAASTSPLSVTISAAAFGTSGTKFTATVTGGTSPYKYDWRCDGVSFVSSLNGSPTLQILSDPYVGKSITCVVTDNNGKTATSNSMSFIASSTPLSVTISPSGTQTVAEGDYYTVNVYASGGTGSYTYYWEYSNNGGSTYNALSSKTSSQTMNCAYAGTVYVRCTVTSGSASKTVSMTIIITKPLTLSVTSNVSAMSTSQSCVLTATASGGTGSYTFAWYVDGGTGSAGGGTKFYYSTSVKGTHTFKCVVTDSKGNTATATCSVGVY